MSLTPRVASYLDECRSRYEVVPHRPAYTAQGVAAASHVSGWQMAKVLVARQPGHGFLMAVLPASCRLDLATLQEVTGRAPLELATEDDLAMLFPDCEVGAMTPFGNLYGIQVYVDTCLEREGTIAFQAGNHREIATMSVKDFEELVKPVRADFCRS
jgi:Ala-tRNA(Pro) deacylase